MAARRIATAGFVSLLALAASACGGNASSRTSPPVQTNSSAENGGGTVRIVMRSLYFNPNAVGARIGQRVVWVNEDSTPHNVEYVSGPQFASSRPILKPGATFSIRLTQAGTIHYYCSIHPWMRATITVSP